jgi:hypothetical protein
LIKGCDLVKIDAEGIEGALLSSVREWLLAERPTLLIEVLPEARDLGAFLAALAAEAGYSITILPEYGLDVPVVADPASFHAWLPAQYRSKNVVLSVRPVPGLAALVAPSHTDRP